MTHFFKTALLSAAVALCFFIPSFAQKNAKTSDKSSPKAEATSPQRIDPSAQVKEVIDRVFNYIDGCTPTTVTDAAGAEIKDLSKIDKGSKLGKGDFSIRSYEWGVAYSGLLLTSEVTGDEKYSKYVYDRFNLLGKLYPYAKDYYDTTGYDMALSSLYSPRFLDDCGAMCAAMIKATLANPSGSREFRDLMEHWFNFVMYDEYRLGSGILARNRPTTNSVWLDDMYMGIPPIAYRAKLSQKERGDLTQKYYNEAVNQILLFKDILWIPEKHLFRHGWIEGMSEHPDYHWARANGWAMLTMCDVLDALPENIQGRDDVLDLLKDLIAGIAPLQSPAGTWHQLIDKPESYLETSASAMYVYCIAHAINNGWIDKTAYQDIAKSGWAGVSKQVNDKGQVENTCVGTGLGWTNTFYESRPVSVYAAHGYGPVLLAGAEMLKLYEGEKKLRGQNPRGMMGPGMPPMFETTKRQEGKPMVFLAGDSTCKNGRGTGDNGQWGWGSFFGEYLSDRVVVDNEAMGGLSSRTFFDNSWPRLRSNIRSGDYVIIQFGHNDMSPLNTGRARGTLDGTADKPQSVVMERNGESVDVYSYGHYIRMMIRQAKMRGATPIVISPTPQNKWAGEKQISRFTDTFSAWCKQVAAEEGATYIDFNDLAARQYEAIGKTEAQKDYFADSVHTREKGARLYCQTLADALRSSGTVLGKYSK